ncbi:hypothetical protein V7S50_12010 [Bacillus sp. CCNWLW194]
MNAERIRYNMDLKEELLFMGFLDANVDDGVDDEIYVMVRFKYHYPTKGNKIFRDGKKEFSKATTPEQMFKEIIQWAKNCPANHGFEIIFW